MIPSAYSHPREGYSPSKVIPLPSYQVQMLTTLAFGHEKVSILNGGLPRWIDEGNEVEMGELQDVGQSEYKGKPLDSAKLRCEFIVLVRSVRADKIAYEEMVKNSQQQKGEGETVLDHRPLARYVYASNRRCC
jgi:thiosulfate/3-mercaptopyruvate sulfurtransferase